MSSTSGTSASGGGGGGDGSGGGGDDEEEEEEGVSIGVTNGRVAVVLFGETGKPLCSKAGRTEQLNAAGWQSSLIFSMLRNMGLGVDVFVSTNDCGPGWREALRRAYQPWLKGLATSDTCDCE
jgi:hypothetical protein